VPRLSKRLTEANIEYVQDLAGAACKHVTGLAGLLKDEMATTTNVTIDEVKKFEEAAADQAAASQRTERAAVRRARKADHDAAAQRYQQMTKAELSEELRARELPKTGNVGELRDRLTKADRHNG
jgi:hypothetical protein